MSNSEANFQPEVPPSRKQRQEWRQVTGKIIRDLPNNPELQEELIGLGTEEVSQTLPAKALDAVAETDEAVAAVADRTDELTDFIHQSPIPEEVVGPDLRLSNLPDKTKQMVGELDREARELKLLALMAEIQKLGGVSLDEHGDAYLPSGIHIHADPEQPISLKPLLDPANYARGQVDKRVLKDRTSKLTVGGHPYVIKERKTGRHTDTSESGHRDGLTSAQEYEIGRQLHESGEIKEDRIHLQWENPLGYVEYPTGYQFMVAAYEPGMMTDPERSVPKLALAELEEAIREHRGTFETEYQSVLSRRPDLTYDHFAIIMANRMMDRVEDMYDEVLAEHQLKSMDTKRGLGFRINTDGGVMLEAIGFDLEYMVPVNSRAAATKAELSTGELYGSPDMTR